MPVPADIGALKAALAAADDVIGQAAAHLGAQGPGTVDANQVVAYDLAHGAAGVAVARAAADYGAHGDTEAALACAFVADAVFELAAMVLGRESQWGVTTDALGGAMGVVRAYRDPAFVASLATTEGPRHLDGDFEMVQDAFRRFAEDKIRPVADEIHRSNGDIPEEVIEGLAEMGCFGLSVPERYGGFASGGSSDLLGMVIATEELSRASLGVGGSLITRPEILTRALLKGGTEEQKQAWLPLIAAGERMVAVAVTEPDYGSDVAGLKVSATPAPGGGWVINGVKTWCTFAARAEVLMLLARTDPDRSRAHRGLSLFIVPKPRTDGRGFVIDQATLGAGGSGRLEGRPIDTIGYRGMHSFELAFSDWWVPAESLIGGEAGLGRGFYWQMEGFEAGRLQTAARAIGVMQAAYEAARDYAAQRVAFGRPIADYQVTQARLGRMAALIQACRQHMYGVARLMAGGAGSLEASMLKAYVCRAAEWVTRQAMQVHGGMGYAEEFPVSRYFVDARVLSIFEGADEVLALKVVARRLVEQAAVPGGDQRER
ncbi:MAG TPA: acyl-CoA dehydrogenase family protein [Acidimicrobiales bacterium]|jgi:(2S)-methylsuccinyl-CoA dehydrogenase|nr:acyl-CoA dehydrogenase family protein [Acidimicrobiales bacterium]